MSDREVSLEFFRAALPLIVHGLKNRLTPAVTQAYLLEEASHFSPEKVREIAASTVLSLERSLALITALPRIVDLEVGKQAEVDVMLWLTAAAERARITLSTTSPALRLTLDTGLWTAALDEVLANVALHGGGRASAAWAKTGDRFELRIRDEGAGLGNMEPKKALEATRRSDGSSGQGLGLSRAMLAMMLLDGSVRIEPSSPGLEVVLEGRLVALTSALPTR